MSKAPYIHSDGSNCYTKNCSLGHYVSSDKAIMHGDADLYIQSKTIENKDASASVDNFFAPTTPAVSSRIAPEATATPKFSSKYPSGSEGESMAMSDSNALVKENNKKETRKRVINAAMWTGTAGVAAVGVATGFVVLALPIIAWGGYQLKQRNKAK